MRLNFEFSEEQIKDLKELQEKAGCATMKELFNSAMSLLDWAVTEVEDGNEILSVNEENQYQRVLVAPFLKKAVRQSELVGA